MQRIATLSGQEYVARYTKRASATGAPTRAFRARATGFPSLVWHRVAA
jgi:hypothetical protein